MFLPSVGWKRHTNSAESDEKRRMELDFLTRGLPGYHRRVESYGLVHGHEKRSIERKPALLRRLTKPEGEMPNPKVLPAGRGANEPSRGGEKRRGGGSLLHTSGIEWYVARRVPCRIPFHRCVRITTEREVV